MDTTPIYLDMCDKSWVDLENDYEEKADHRGESLFEMWDKGGGNIRTRAAYRQDQLQEMYGEGYPNTLDEFHEFAYKQIVDPLKYPTLCCLREEVKQFKTMEQLWLAFVMQERWNKTWNLAKKEWVK